MTTPGKGHEHGSQRGPPRESRLPVDGYLHTGLSRPRVGRTIPRLSGARQTICRDAGKTQRGPPVSVAGMHSSRAGPTRCRCLQRTSTPAAKGPAGARAHLTTRITMKTPVAISSRHFDVGYDRESSPLRHVPALGAFPSQDISPSSVPDPPCLSPWSRPPRMIIDTAFKPAYTRANSR
jgi:hypothetical protein